MQKECRSRLRTLTQQTGNPQNSSTNRGNNFNKSQNNTRFSTPRPMQQNQQRNFQPNRPRFQPR
jgi:hypothetical protein